MAQHLALYTQNIVIASFVRKVELGRLDLLDMYEKERTMLLKYKLVLLLIGNACANIIEIDSISVGSLLFFCRVSKTLDSPEYAN